MEWNAVSEADTMVVAYKNLPSVTETTPTNHGKADIRGKAGLGLGIRFEPQGPTSYSGPVVLGHLFYPLGVGERLWGCFRRFILIGKQVKRQHKQPIQPDLFRPVEYGYEFKVIVTNKRTDPRDIVAFHEGHGSQEDALAELKTRRRMDYMPVGTRVGNQPYMFAGIPARNLTREPHIQIGRRARGTTPKRAALWCFREMETLRRTPVRRTGRIIRPGGKLILSMNCDDGLEGELRHALTALNAA